MEKLASQGLGSSFSGESKIVYCEEQSFQFFFLAMFSWPPIWRRLNSVIL